MLRREEPLVSSLDVREVREVSRTWKYLIENKNVHSKAHTWFMEEWEAEKDDFECDWDLSLRCPW